MLENLHGSAATFTKGIINKMRETDTEKCTGQTAAITKETGLKESSMALAE